MVNYNNIPRKNNKPPLEECTPIVDMCAGLLCAANHCYEYYIIYYRPIPPELLCLRYTLMNYAKIFSIYTVLCIFYTALCTSFFIPYT